MAAIALSVGEAILLIALAAVPFAVLAFILGARSALGQIGSGRFSIEQEPPPRDQAGAPIAPETREAEVRQMVEAKAYRRRRRGEGELDVDAEVDRLLEAEDAGSRPRADPDLVAEVRQLVIARNERRERQGKEPLDVESEVERRLAELRELDS